MKARTILTAGLFFGMSLFCLGQGLTLFDSIISGGIYRKYRMYVPPSYSNTKAAPLVLNLHGYTSNAGQQLLYSNFMPIADTAGFLMVCPDGTAPFGNPFWNAGLASTPDDVLFISDLIDSLKLDYNINIRRIYSCGFSNGGIMSYYLACQMSSRMAAIASVAGTMFSNWFASCNPPRPIPVMEIHGTNDGIVAYNGNSNFTPVDSIIKKWLLHNGCNPAPVTTSVANISTSDNSTAVHYLYTNGTAGSSVELYRVNNGSHSWPGAFPIFANTNQDFSASVEIWRFFRQYTLDQFVNDVGLRAYNSNSNIRLYPNPANSVLIVDGVADGAPVSVLAPDGRLLLERRLQQQQLNLSSLPTGIYFLQVKEEKQNRLLRFIKE